MADDASPRAAKRKGPALVQTPAPVDTPVAEAPTQESTVDTPVVGMPSDLGTLITAHNLVQKLTADLADAQGALQAALASLSPETKALFAQFAPKPPAARGTSPRRAAAAPAGPRLARGEAETRVRNLDWSAPKRMAEIATQAELHPSTAQKTIRKLADANEVWESDQGWVWGPHPGQAEPVAEEAVAA